MTKPLVQRLDDLANRTGIPQLTTTPPRRRPRFWLPVFTIGLGILGIGVTLFGKAMFGSSPLSLGVALSGWLASAGPIKPLLSIDGIDEREKQVRAEAYLFASPVVLIAAIVLLALAPWRVLVQAKAADDFDLLFLQIFMGVNAALFLAILWTSIPTLYASLKWPIDEDDAQEA